MSNRIIFNEKQVAYLNHVQHWGDHIAIQKRSDECQLMMYTQELNAGQASGKIPKKLDRRRSL